MALPPAPPEALGPAMQPPGLMQLGSQGVRARASWATASALRASTSGNPPAALPAACAEEAAHAAASEAAPDEANGVTTWPAPPPALAGEGMHEAMAKPMLEAAACGLGVCCGRAVMTWTLTFFGASGTRFGAGADTTAAGAVKSRPACSPAEPSMGNLRAAIGNPSGRRR
eukprot:CAMPEP_0180488718 /NCGR_PEP_ID=MMETSP1036_2-20121128/38200_1 /TAXON_ID=632150 /ORGANISM="Azadinium spinosum, Strain 3D9" /LENGTH=170 /DNA_ID=CAMNT_0022496801 /DNA_START=11 /DNA_END=520 /DNA_ORIENTATION=-